MAKYKVLSSDEDIERALAETASMSEEPIVSSVSFENVDGRMSVILKMSDGSVHGIPKSKLQDVANATDEVASRVEITADGLGIRWPDLDLDMYVPALFQGIYGTKAWMSSLGRLGGKARSEAKGTAARLNGRRGGRPRKRTGSCDLEACATSSRRGSGACRKHSRRDPIRDHVPSLRFKFNRGVYAALFGLDAFATAKTLPRIA